MTCREPFKVGHRSLKLLSKKKVYSSRRTYPCYCYYYYYYYYYDYYYSSSSDSRRTTSRRLERDGRDVPAGASEGEERQRYGNRHVDADLRSAYVCTHTRTRTRTRTHAHAHAHARTRKRTCTRTRTRTHTLGRCRCLPNIDLVLELPCGASRLGENRSAVPCNGNLISNGIRNGSPIRGASRCGAERGGCFRLHAEPGRGAATPCHAACLGTAQLP